MTDGCAPYKSGDCYIYPDCPAVAAVAPHNEVRNELGWNAGANSIDALSTDFHTVFTMPRVTGTIIGLRSERAHQATPDFIEHGLYFRALLDTDLVSIMERGAELTLPITRGIDDTFEIRRVGTRVTYWRNRELMCASTEVSNGTKVVNMCLFASGDYIAGDEAVDATPVNAGVVVMPFAASGSGSFTEPPPDAPQGDGSTHEGGDLPPDGSTTYDATMGTTDYYQFTIEVVAGVTDLNVFLYGNDGQYAMWLSQTRYDDIDSARAGADVCVDSYAYGSGTDMQAQAYVSSPAAGTWYLGMYATVGSTLTTVQAQAMGA